ncbi:aminotransferase class IV [Humisphaera borealis]|uniref:Aminotransferase class IV family protein n=1 Tax=Humisphaera borealis TaxID=2807512 RepID=A0A7M2WYH3_9BACT|nr:aminotransferase class IV [Humisphaera borealis]QOV89881.1 aminotransferase class IV family protein [Humisphaera borealis]
MSFAWINGSFIDEESATISIRDTGLLHAAGVFTTMRAYGGSVFMLDRHLARVRESCDALFVPLQQRDEAIAAATTELLQRNGLAEARLRLTVTRGRATQDPLHGMRLEPTVLLTAAPLEPYPQEYYQKGMTVIVLDEQKLNPYDLQAGHKTLNYFSRLSALKEANRRQAGEALWFNVHNYLQCGSITNVLIVKDGRLVTPPTNEELREESIRQLTPYPKSNVLPGVTRSVVFDLAAEAGIEVVKRGVSISDLLEADEVFITNSNMGIMPVCRIERKAIGGDKPGKVTLGLMEAYAEAVAQSD